MYIVDHDIHVEDQPNFLESVQFSQEQENNNLIIVTKTYCMTWKVPVYAFLVWNFHAY